MPFSLDLTFVVTPICPLTMFCSVNGAALSKMLSLSEHYMQFDMEAGCSPHCTFDALSSASNGMHSDDEPIVDDHLHIVAWTSLMRTEEDNLKHMSCEEDTT